MTHHGASWPLEALCAGAKSRVKDSRSEPRSGGRAVLDAEFGAGGPWGAASSTVNFTNYARFSIPINTGEPVTAEPFELGQSPCRCKLGIRLKALGQRATTQLFVVVAT